MLVLPTGATPHLVRAYKTRARTTCLRHVSISTTAASHSVSTRRGACRPQRPARPSSSRRSKSSAPASTPHASIWASTKTSVTPSSRAVSSRHHEPPHALPRSVTDSEGVIRSHPHGQGRVPRGSSELVRAVQTLIRGDTPRTTLHASRTTQAILGRHVVLTKDQGFLVCPNRSGNHTEGFPCLT